MVATELNKVILEMMKHADMLATVLETLLKLGTEPCTNEHRKQGIDVAKRALELHAELRRAASAGSLDWMETHKLREAFDGWKKDNEGMVFEHHAMITREGRIFSNNDFMMIELVDKLIRSVRTKALEYMQQLDKDGDLKLRAQIRVMNERSISHE